MNKIFSPTQIRALIEYLNEFVSEERKKRFNDILKERLEHMHVVLEDVYQAHNASAVVRSADCFGIQNLHFIENKNKYKVSEEVALGASQWVNIHRHKNTTEALHQLKKQGFKIVATTPHTKDKTIYELDVTQKFALVFGTEQEGISKEVLDVADEFVKIPMYGFTESFNISVSAALCMHELSHRIREQVKDPYLAEEEKSIVYFDWQKQSIKKPDLLIADFLKKRPDL
ncbi:MAG: TrmH family RNA methyltransferase [Bacteroidia bacterium]